MPQLGRELLPKPDELTQKPDWQPHEELLRLSVMVAVPLQIAELKARGGPNDFQWDWARDYADELGARGDDLQFKGARKGETAQLFKNFAYALAILAFLPGGVRFAGLHFEATVVGDVGVG